jgi:hypothetical protein
MSKHMALIEFERFSILHSRKLRGCGNSSSEGLGTAFLAEFWSAHGAIYASFEQSSTVVVGWHGLVFGGE